MSLASAIGWSKRKAPVVVDSTGDSVGDSVGDAIGDSATNSPVEGQPVITGTPWVGETLTADASGISDADGLGTFNYQWLRDGSVIAGATSDTYELTAADRDSYVSVEVSYEDSAGNTESTVSERTQLIKFSSNEFVSIYRTTAANEQITIPTRNIGTFNAQIDWGDGNVSTITSYNQPDLTHSFADPGDHLVRVIGSFPNIYFNNAGDKNKLIEVIQLGNVGWQTFQGAFFGCANLTRFTSGGYTIPAVSYVNNMLRACAALNYVNMDGFVLANIANMSLMMPGLVSLSQNPYVGELPGSAFQYCNNAFRDWPVQIDESVGFHEWDYSSAIQMAGMFGNSSIATSAYDLILIQIADNPHQSNVQFDAGNSRYTLGGPAEAARSALIADGWTITDLGGV